jgi:hypothetical protein
MSAEINIDLDLVNKDADRLCETRAKSKEDSRTMSLHLLAPFLALAKEHSLSENQLRRLVAHNIKYQAGIFAKEYSFDENNQKINEIISLQNQTLMTKLGNARVIASHYKAYGFNRGDYSQLRAKQYSESISYLNHVQTIQNENETDRQLRISKQALIVLPKQGNSDFDFCKEVEDLKRLNYNPLFIQINNKEELYLFDENDHETFLKQLGNAIGGFGLLVVTGFGENGSTQQVNFSNDINNQANNNLSKADFKDLTKSIDFILDKTFLSEHGSFVCLANGFTGTKAQEGKEHITPKDSMASLVKWIRPDLDIQGCFDDFSNFESIFYEKEGRLEHSLTRRLDEEELDEKKITKAIEEAYGEKQLKTENADQKLADLYNIFDDEEE